MKAQIQQWGNSLGVRIPQVLAKKLHFKQGVVVNLEITEDGLFISTKTSELDVLLIILPMLIVIMNYLIVMIR